MGFRFAHFSDIHFFSLRMSPLNLFCKRIVGSSYFLLVRRSKWRSDLANQVVDHLLHLGIKHVVITGDFTVTSTKREFEISYAYINALRERGLDVFLIPGNHDMYTKGNVKNKCFYNTFDTLVDFGGVHNFNMQRDKVAAFNIHDNWYILFVDCATNLPFYKSGGVFCEKAENNVTRLLSKLPAGANIIVGSHFPYDEVGKRNGWLAGGDKLQSIIDGDKRVQLFLHGHTHVPRIERRGNHVVLCSGSISIKKDSHFSIIELGSNTHNVTRYTHNDNGVWLAKDDKK